MGAGSSGGSGPGPSTSTGGAAGPETAGSGGFGGEVDVLLARQPSSSGVAGPSGMSAAFRSKVGAGGWLGY